MLLFIEKVEIIEEIIQDVTSLCEIYELIKPEDKVRFVKRLRFLINNKQIYYAAKADSLISNYGNVFIQSKIISDIRPVFDIQIEDEPQASIISHNLNIHYQSNDEPYHKDISLVLNLNDIKTLKEVLIRAEKKNTVLQNLLQEWNEKLKRKL